MGMRWPSRPVSTRCWPSRPASSLSSALSRPPSPFRRRRRTRSGCPPGHRRGRRGGRRLGVVTAWHSVLERRWAMSGSASRWPASWYVGVWCWRAWRRSPRCGRPSSRGEHGAIFARTVALTCMGSMVISRASTVRASVVAVDVGDRTRARPDVLDLPRWPRPRACVDLGVQALHLDEPAAEDRQHERHADQADVDAPARVAQPQHGRRRGRPRGPGGLRGGPSPRAAREAAACCSRRGSGGACRRHRERLLAGPAHVAGGLFAGTAERAVVRAGPGALVPGRGMRCPGAFGLRARAYGTLAGTLLARRPRESGRATRQPGPAGAGPLLVSASRPSSLTNGPKGRSERSGRFLGSLGGSSGRPAPSSEPHPACRPAARSAGGTARARGPSREPAPPRPGPCPLPPVSLTVPGPPGWCGAVPRSGRWACPVRVLTLQLGLVGDLGGTHASRWPAWRPRWPAGPPRSPCAGWPR